MALSYRQRQRIEKVARALWASGAWGKFDGSFDEQPEDVKDIFRRRAMNAVDHRLASLRRSDPTLSMLNDDER